MVCIDSPLEGWREMDSNFRYRGTKAVNFRNIPGIAGYPDAQTIDAFVNTAQVGPFFLPHSSISARKVVRGFKRSVPQWTRRNS